MEKNSGGGTPANIVFAWGLGTVDIKKRLGTVDINVTTSEKLMGDGTPMGGRVQELTVGTSLVD